MRKHWSLKVRTGKEEDLVKDSGDQRSIASHRALQFIWCFHLSDTKTLGLKGGVGSGVGETSVQSIDNH